ncbi:MAG: hypothetical protein BWY83_03073 [bacterium ADurb.Bin478]|nr:MAG: hypothetical protein BWY83_03073 [bacterium ADurb.Bin478]
MNFADRLKQLPSAETGIAENLNQKKNEPGRSEKHQHAQQQQGGVIEKNKPLQCNDGKWIESGFGRPAQPLLQKSGQRIARGGTDSAVRRVGESDVVFTVPHFLQQQIIITGSGCLDTVKSADLIIQSPAIAPVGAVGQERPLMADGRCADDLKRPGIQSLQPG